MLMLTNQVSNWKIVFYNIPICTPKKQIKLKNVMKNLPIYLNLFENNLPIIDSNLSIDSKFVNNLSSKNEQ